MEFGMFHEFQCPPGHSEEQAFAESFEQVDAAEQLGLDAMWLAELHMLPRRSVLSAPLTVASAIAARTRKIKIGIAVQVLPLCHPLRLAEEAATVDQISHGRLIFGVGRSGFPEPTKPTVYPTVRAVSALARFSKSLNRHGLRPAFLIRANITALTKFTWCRSLIKSPIHRSAWRQRAPTHLRASAS